MTDPGPVFSALADPTRRAVLRAVAGRGTATATELTAEIDVTRQAVAKHLRILEDAGLVAAGADRPRAALPRDARRRSPMRSPGWPRSGAAWDVRLERLAAKAARPV